MIYLPDTNAFSRFFRGDDLPLRQRFLAEWVNVRLSVIVIAELEFGASKSGVVRHRARLDELLLTAAGIEAWTADDAAAYGRVRSNLERRGILVGAHDMQVAAQAIRLGATVVTHNRRHFADVPGLKIADWQSLP